MLLVRILPPCKREDMQSKAKTKLSCPKGAATQCNAHALQACRPVHYYITKVQHMQRSAGGQLGENTGCMAI